MRTDNISFNNIFSAPGYNPNTNKLTFAPNDSITIRYRWNLKTNDSTLIIRYSTFRADRTCLVFVSKAPYDEDLGYRRISDNEKFKINFRIKLFSKLGATVAPTLFYQNCFIAPHFGERQNCPELDLQNLCNYNP